MGVLNYIRIFRILRAMLREAQSYRTDDSRTGDLADTALAKAQSKRGALAAVFTELSALIRLVKAWATRRYRAIPWRSASLIIAGLLYFVSPLDAIPDFIPGMGFLDDAFIITWLMRAVHEELEKFRAWEASTT